MSFGFSDHLRQTHNATRIGTIEEINWARHEIRVRTGDILTNWLPFPAGISNNYRHWIPLRRDTQVILVVDGGDYNTAIITGILWSNDVPALDMPEDERPTRDRVEFDDGTVVEYDSQRQNLNIHTPGNIHIHAGGDIRIDGCKIYLNCGAEETWNYV